jgi:hypothetical protein
MIERLILRATVCLRPRYYANTGTVPIFAKLILTGLVEASA